VSTTRLPWDLVSCDANATRSPKLSRTLDVEYTATYGCREKKWAMVTKKEDPYYSNTKGATKKGLAPKPRPYKPPKAPK